MFQGSWGCKEAQLDMVNSKCVPSRLTAAWVQNHYALIVWKIACQIRSYPDHFQDQWQPKSILNQLLYRYEREINMGQRPVLKKILEQDDNSVKHMVLVIADIIETRNSSFYNTCKSIHQFKPHSAYKQATFLSSKISACSVGWMVYGTFAHRPENGTCSC